MYKSNFWTFLSGWLPTFPTWGLKIEKMLLNFKKKKFPVTNKLSRALC